MHQPAIPEGLAVALRSARRITVLTGAGVSAESGIPTFREALGGLWARFNPEDLATPEAFERNPRLVWEWYRWRAELVQQAQPNPGHLALARLERLVPSLTLITQNVDGLHQRAGSHNLVELHGSLARCRCSLCPTVLDVWPATSDGSSLPPPCPSCGAPLRPDVVWFGELLPRAALERAVAAATACDLFLSIGTSGMVEPAASLPLVAQRRGAALAVINLDVANGQSERVYYLHGRSGELLPALVAHAFGPP